MPRLLRLRGQLGVRVFSRWREGFYTGRTVRWRSPSIAIGGIGAALVLAGIVALNLLRPVAGHPAQPAAPAAGTFRPTEPQWRGLKIAPVQLLTFRSERVTEGNIAIDDDLNTPVF